MQEQSSRMKRPRIYDARTVCQKLGGRGAIVLVFDRATAYGVFYGETKREGAQMERLLDAIVVALQNGELEAWWPEGENT